MEGSVNEDEFEVESDECEHGGGFISYAWSWFVLPIAFLSFWIGVARAFQSSIGQVVEALCAASNHEVDQKDFHTQAALEIEKLTEAKPDA
jgi:hypothetical protein